MIETPENNPRLGAQARRVFALMSDGKARTLEQISQGAGAPAASASARLRDLRKAGHCVIGKHMGCGLWSYRVEV
jgi:hypothetical protein